MNVILEDFLRESNRIEGIYRDPSREEMSATVVFLELKEMSVAALTALVVVYQRGARLRDQPGVDVRVGRYFPPFGGPEVRTELEALIVDVNKHLGLRPTPYQAHVRYELLHPFTDGNGRAGRALWLWMMQKAKISVSLPFLHHFYYQALAEASSSLRREAHEL